MLLLKPSCEYCDKDLPAHSLDAMICSYECTFCRDCVEQRLNGRCPNCGGELLRRPIRPQDRLAKNPASTERIHKPTGCS